MVDPITLTGLALGGLAGAAGTSLMGGPKPAAPQAPPEQAAPPQAPIGNRQGGGQTAQPSFIGASAVPQTGGGQKTLLGQ